jgi:fructose-1,6-bisphosphatase class II
VQGKIVIGEGERDDGVPLFDGQHLGGETGPELQVAVNAIDGAVAAASGSANAMSIIAISDDPAQGFLRCPRVHMEKIAVGPQGRGVVDLDRTPTENLNALAEACRVYVEDLTVAILDRPRHAKLIAEVRKAGARIRLIPAGEVAAALATTRPESGIDLVMGVGGDSQGVLAAAALLCAGGMMQARFLPTNAEEGKRLAEAGISDGKKKLVLEDLVHGSVMFAATGVTSGSMLKGVRRFGNGAETHSIVMRSKTGTVRWISAHHNFSIKTGLPSWA